MNLGARTLAQTLAMMVMLVATLAGCSDRMQPIRDQVTPIVVDEYPLSVGEPIPGVLDGVSYTYYRGCVSETLGFTMVVTGTGNYVDSAGAPRMGLPAPYAAKWTNAAPEIGIGHDDKNYWFKLSSGIAVVEFEPDRTCGQLNPPNPTASSIRGLLFPIGWRFIHLPAISTGAFSSRFIVCMDPNTPTGDQGEQICFADDGHVVASLPSASTEADAKRVTEGWRAEPLTPATVDILDVADIDRDVFVNRARYFFKLVRDKHN